VEVSVVVEIVQGGFGAVKNVDRVEVGVVDEMMKVELGAGGLIMEWWRTWLWMI
jgi:hypothetical protein